MATLKESNDMIWKDEKKQTIHQYTHKQQSNLTITQVMHLNTERAAKMICCLRSLCSLQCPLHLNENLKKKNTNKELEH